MVPLPHIFNLNRYIALLAAAAALLAEIVWIFFWYLPLHTYLQKNTRYTSTLWLPVSSITTNPSSIVWHLSSASSAFHIHQHIRLLKIKFKLSTVIWSAFHTVWLLYAWESWNVTWLIIVSIRKKGVSQVVSGKKPANQCRRLDPWVRKIPWRRERATHSSILAWRIPWTGEPGRLQTTESHWVRHGWSDLAGTHTYTFGKNANYTIGRGKKKKKNLSMYSAGRERPHVGIGKHNLLQGWQFYHDLSPHCGHWSHY